MGWGTAVTVLHLSLDDEGVRRVPEDSHSAFLPPVSAGRELSGGNSDKLGEGWLCEGRGRLSGPRKLLRSVLQGGVVSSPSAVMALGREQLGFQSLTLNVCLLRGSVQMQMLQR